MFLSIVCSSSGSNVDKSLLCNLRPEFLVIIIVNVYSPHVFFPGVVFKLKEIGHFLISLLCFWWRKSLISKNPCASIFLCYRRQCAQSIMFQINHKSLDDEMLTRPSHPIDSFPANQFLEPQSRHRLHMQSSICYPGHKMHDWFLKNIVGIFFLNM